jgi:hypothetical protein
VTDDEIIQNLQKADALLAQYKAIIEPVADELARRKSLAVYAKEGGYAGDLGCQEYGMDTVCLHRREEFAGKTYEEDVLHEEVAITFDIQWAGKARAAGVQHVNISGHY